MYKVKDGFKVRKIGAQTMAVPTGRRTTELHGMLWLSESGALLWQALTAGAEPEELARLLRSPREDTEFLRLSLPKFEAEWSGELRDALSALGLDTAFDPDRADFSRLGDDPRGYFLSQVIHAARIEVNERGTEAAAATVVAAESGATAPPPEGVELDLDRPFLYGIADRETGVPLFLGTFL